VGAKVEPSDLGQSREVWPVDGDFRTAASPISAPACPARAAAEEEEHWARPGERVS